MAGRHPIPPVYPSCPSTEPPLLIIRLPANPLLIVPSNLSSHWKSIGDLKWFAQSLPSPRTTFPCQALGNCCPNSGWWPILDADVDVVRETYPYLMQGSGDFALRRHMGMPNFAARTSKRIHIQDRQDYTLTVSVLDIQIGENRPKFRIVWSKKGIGLKKQEQIVLERSARLNLDPGSGD